MRLAGTLQMSSLKIWDLQELCKCQVLKYETCRNSANAKTQNLELAGTLQTPKLRIWNLQELCKRQNSEFGTCRNSANVKTQNLVFAGTLQTLSKLRRRLIGYPIPLKWFALRVREDRSVTFCCISTAGLYLCGVENQKKMVTHSHTIQMDNAGETEILPRRKTFTHSPYTRPILLLIFALRRVSCVVHFHEAAGCDTGYQLVVSQTK